MADIADNLREGAAVALGDVLVRIEEREYRAKLERARSQLESARAELDNIAIEDEDVSKQLRIANIERDVAERELARVQNLFDNGLAGRRELDNAQIDLESKRRVLSDLQRRRETIPNTRRQRAAAIALREADVDLASAEPGAMHAARPV